MATTTTVSCTPTAGCENKITQAAINSTENLVVITVSPGRPATVQFTGTSAWYYRSIGTDGTTHDATTQEPVAAGQPLTLRFTQTTTFYFVRQTADGTLAIKPLKVE